MIARHRGDLRAHSRWRPSTPVVSAPATTTTDDHDVYSERSDELFSEQHDLDLPRGTQRKPRALIVIATIVAIAVITGQQHSAPSHAAPRLPSTPQQWVSQWAAATLQSPAEICNHLYAPALAHAFKGDTGHSCTWHYTSVTSTSFRIRHMLEDGPPRPSKPKSSALGASGPTSRCSSATSTAAGKPLTSYPADQSAHARP